VTWLASVSRFSPLAAVVANLPVFVSTSMNWGMLVSKCEAATQTPSDWQTLTFIMLHKICLLSFRSSAVALVASNADPNMTVLKKGFMDMFTPVNVESR
jgi:hypothetical protein